MTLTTDGYTKNQGSSSGTAANFDVGTGANNVVQLDGSAKLPAVDGSALTNIPVVIHLPVTDPNGDAITTGDGQGPYFRVPADINGWNLTEVHGSLSTSSSSGIPTAQIRNATQAADMLTTKLTIDASETDSSTAATAVVIDTSNDDVATGDQIFVDIDVAGTGAKGLFITLKFEAP